MPLIVKWIAVQVALIVGIVGCAGESDRFLVFAATSLTDSLDEIVPAFEEESGVQVSVSLAGSQLLAQQILKGAPADVFIAAGVAPVEMLFSEGLLDPQTEPIVTWPDCLVHYARQQFHAVVGVTDCVQRTAGTKPSPRVSPR